MRTTAMCQLFDAASRAAGIYAMWERELRTAVNQRMVPAGLRQLVGPVQMKKVLDWMVTPPGELGTDPIAARDELLVASLTSAVAALVDRLGPDPTHWTYGQADYKHALIRHPLSTAVNAANTNAAPVAITGSDGWIRFIDSNLSRGFP